MNEENLKVNIAGREYPLKVKADETALIKKAEEAINDCVVLYEKSFSIKDKQDLLAMCLLNFASQLQKKEASDTTQKTFEKQLEETEQYLTKYLNTLVL